MTFSVFCVYIERERDERVREKAGERSEIEEEEGVLYLYNVWMGMGCYGAICYVSPSPLAFFWAL